MIWDDAKQTVVITLAVLTTVRGIRLSRTHIVIALQNSIRVYNFKTKPDLWAAFETADNPLGLCCLATKILAFPGRTPGQVQLVELATGNVSIIPAHGSALRAIDISRDGEVLATASETVCSIFRVYFEISDSSRGHSFGSLQQVIVLGLLNSVVGWIMQRYILYLSPLEVNCSL